MAVMAPELIDLDEAAKRFGVVRHTITEWIRIGRIPAELVIEQTSRSRFILWDVSRLPRRTDGTMPEPGDPPGDD